MIIFEKTKWMNIWSMSFSLRAHDKNVYMYHKYKDAPHNSRSSERKEACSLDDIIPNHLHTLCMENTF
jgi:hypothetical protein